MMLLLSVVGAYVLGRLIVRAIFHIVYGLKQ